MIRVFRRSDDSCGRPSDLSAEAQDVLTPVLLPGLEIPLARVLAGSRSEQRPPRGCGGLCCYSLAVSQEAATIFRDLTVKVFADFLLLSRVAEAAGFSDPVVPAIPSVGA